MAAYTCKTSTYTCKGATYTCKTSAYTCKDATYTCKTSTYTCKTSTYTCKMPTDKGKMAFLFLQEFSNGKRPKKRGYAMDFAGVPPPTSHNPPGKPVFRDITEAVYCTCWDKDIRVHDDEATKFKVETGPQ